MMMNYFSRILNKPEISGVIFTRDINNLAPYFVINYDVSGKTNLITGVKFISRNFNFA